MTIRSILEPWAAWDRRPLLVGLLVAVAIRHPWLWSLLAVDPAHRWWKGRREARVAAWAIPDQQATAARTLLVALTAGLPIAAAMELAAGSTTGVVAAEIRQVLRRARQEGISGGLSIGAGPHTRALCSRLALASASGAPVAEAVAAYLGDLRSERRASTLERVRRLPVSLMVPLGLLILPGFVALFVGPIVVNSLTELIGTLP